MLIKNISLDAYIVINAVLRQKLLYIYCEIRASIMVEFSPFKTWYLIGTPIVKKIWRS